MVIQMTKLHYNNLISIPAVLGGQL